MIVVDNVEYRNLEEQVLKNKDDISEVQNDISSLKSISGLFNIVGRVNSFEDLPSLSTVNEGDVYLVGTSMPYYYFIKVNNNYYNLGTFQSDIAGPQGETGPQGADGVGIKSASLQGGDLQLTFTDGSTLVVGNVTGPQGPRGLTGPKGDTGPQGPQGEALEITFEVDQLSELPSASSQYNGIFALVGSEPPRVLYRCNGNEWIDEGYLNYGYQKLSHPYTLANSKLSSVYTNTIKLNQTEDAVPGEVDTYRVTSHINANQLNKVGIDSTITASSIFIELGYSATNKTIAFPYDINGGSTNSWGSVQDVYIRILDYQNYDGIVLNSYGSDNNIAAFSNSDEHPYIEIIVKESNIFKQFTTIQVINNVLYLMPTYQYDL